MGAKVTEKDSMMKVERHRLSVLEMAESLGNISDACREFADGAKISIRHEVTSVYDRWLKVEERYLREGIELTTEQVARIEKFNLGFRERHVESSRPGELLSQDTFMMGNLKGIGTVYMHGCVDTYGSYGFGFGYLTTTLNGLTGATVGMDSCCAQMRARLNRRHSRAASHLKERVLGKGLNASRTPR